MRLSRKAGETGIWKKKKKMTAESEAKDWMCVDRFASQVNKLVWLPVMVIHFIGSTQTKEQIFVHVSSHGATTKHPHEVWIHVRHSARRRTRRKCHAILLLHQFIVPAEHTTHVTASSHPLAAHPTCPRYQNKEQIYNANSIAGPIIGRNGISACAEVQASVEYTQNGNLYESDGVAANRTSSEGPKRTALRVWHSSGYSRLRSSNENSSSALVWCERHSSVRRILEWMEIVEHPLFSPARALEHVNKHLCHKFDIYREWLCKRPHQWRKIRSK